ncbi:hypothetical protein [Pseudoduganella violaceinigra]|uniref:hypothetical protein n=1 Tax=Pseudoduganella violaceinigra TaxID=246602 RepID=UPI0012B5BD59|nr:hypothetical protein [Pseudoduganella violaceinigra]
MSTLRNLLEYLTEQGSELDPADVADRAIREWLERQRGPAKRRAPLGYWWKTVFLPDGSRLRISSRYCVHFATVVGDEIIYNSLSVSPNQFATASLGTVRNAWEAIYVQLPGERDWKPAVRLRYAAAAQAQRLDNREAEARARETAETRC